MDAAGEGGQGTGPVFLHAAEKLGHVAPGAQVQGAGQLAVDGVLDDDIQDLAPGVHDGVELPAHVLGGVAAGGGADKARPGMAQE